MRRHLTSLVAVAVVPFFTSSARGQGLVLEVFGEPEHAHYGAALAGVGDVDQDGFDDLLVGAPWVPSTAEIVSGKDGTRIHLFDAAATNDLFGWAVLGPGDLDQDGIPDAVVGAHRSATGGNLAGEVYAYSGATGALLWSRAGQAGQILGYSLGPAGDFDQDGTPDVLAGGGGATLLSGATGLVLASFPTPSTAWKVDGGEDVDQDGTPDILVGMPLIGAAHHAGVVHLLSGATGALLHAIGGTAAQEAFGSDVDLLSDLDGDGRVDFVVGAPGVNPGRVRAYSGSTGTLLWTTSGAGSRFGVTIAELPDLTADGRPELVVGAEHHFGGPGTAEILNGATGAVLFGVEGQVMLGEVASAGDVNGDGQPDFAVGDQHAVGPDGFSLRGTARVYSSVCGSVKPLGPGCPGSGGQVPLLSLDGCMTPSSAFGLAISNGLGGAPAMLLIGSPAGLPLGAGCLLGVAPSTAVIVTTVLSGVGAGNGSLYVTGDVPLDAPLGFVSLQALVLDPASPIGISATRRLSVEIR